MHRTNKNHLTLAVIFTSAASILSTAAAAEEPNADSQTAESVVPRLIERIVTDPNRAYADVQGPSDCESEILYETTIRILDGYAKSPTENALMVKRYVLSDKRQCNCTGAIVGKDFDILLHDVGTSISTIPCR